MKSILLIAATLFFSVGALAHDQVYPKKGKTTPPSITVSETKVLNQLLKK